MNRITRLAAAILCGAAFAVIASPASAGQSEARLIGAWQEGLTWKLAQGSPEQRAMARKAGLLGAIVVYKADHRFELYPPCGAKQDDLRKVGLQFVPGTWKLSDAGDLIVAVSLGGRTLETKGKVQWNKGQMTWLDKNGRVQQKAAGKYDGPLPPAC